MNILLEGRNNLLRDKNTQHVHQSTKECRYGNLLGIMTLNMSIRPRKNEDIAKTIPEPDASRNDAAAESKPSAAAAGGGVGLCPRGRGEGGYASRLREPPQPRSRILKHFGTFAEVLSISMDSSVSLVTA